MKLIIAILLIGVATAALHLPERGEVELITNAWNAVKNNEIEILYFIFKSYPDIQSHFPKFAGKDLDSIKGSADFAIHATRIVSLISQLHALSQHGESHFQASFTVINEFASNHKNRGIPKDQITEFNTALTKYVSTHAPWDEKTATAWNKGMSNFFEIVFANYDGNPINSI
uniref:Globin n=1 Tax=Polypedilum vanderplanki TaxID=319348 RepID=S6BTM7_POLVA|nr:globin [Polypedilum vanderplanki]